MATRGRPKFSPATKQRAKEAKKELQKEYDRTHKPIRLSVEVYSRLEELKKVLKTKSWDETVSVLIDKRDEKKEKRMYQKEATPRKMPEASQSTPLTVGQVLPSFPVSDISDSNGGSESDRGKDTEEVIVMKYLERAKQTETSFVDISFEIMEDVDESYRPSSGTESDDNYDEDEDDFDENEVDDYLLDMSLHLQPDDRLLPIRAAADVIYHLDSEDESEIEEEEEEEEEEIIQEDNREFVTEKKAICFEKNIVQLAKIHVSSKCNRKACTSLVSIVTKTIGTSIRISWVCGNGHTIKTWDSQPVVRRMRVGDILMSAATLTSGNNYDKINLLFKFFGMGMTNKSTHYKLQTRHFCPIIGEEYELMQKRNIEKYIAKTIVIAGDGRMDSPGFSAQYCTYTLMEHETKDILASIIIDKRMTSLKSTAMELEGLRRGLKIIQDSGVLIGELVTDASTSVAAMMRKDYSTIRHSFDTWHGAKNLGKKLGAVAAETKNKELRPWVPHLINHFWYCSRTSSGKENIILAKWRGALHHVTNVHEWVFGDGAIEPKCDHGQLVDTEEVKWLEPGGISHQSLTKTMLDTRLMHNLHHYANFRHTGELENLHEHILMYCAKRFAYSYPAYKARNYLAMIDYTEHLDRPVLLKKNGEPMLHRCYSKKNKAYSVYKEKIPKTYRCIPTLQERLLQRVFNRTEPVSAPIQLTPSDPRKIKKRLSGISPPSSKRLMELKRSRFSQSKISLSDVFQSGPTDN